MRLAAAAAAVDDGEDGEDDDMCIRCLWRNTVLGTAGNATAGVRECLLLSRGISYKYLDRHSALGGSVECNATAGGMKS